jgi:hypothetical protein
MVVVYLVLELTEGLAPISLPKGSGKLVVCRYIMELFVMILCPFFL